MEGREIVGGEVRKTRGRKPGKASEAGFREYDLHTAQTDGSLVARGCRQYRRHNSNRYA